MAGSGRTNADSVLILEMAAGRTVSAAATAAGISERTAGRRLADVEFRRRITNARAVFIEQALGRLADASTKAVDALVRLLEAESETAKLGAARAVLEHVGRFREHVDLAERIKRMEEALRNVQTCETCRANRATSHQISGAG